MYLNLGHTINEMQDDAKEAPVCALFKTALVTVILHHALEFQKVYGFDRFYSRGVWPTR